METSAIVHQDAVPLDDDWFDLTIDKSIAPMDVVTSAGYNTKGWKYLSDLQLPGRQTLRVKLVRLGYVRNLEEARESAGKLGCQLVDGQAGEPFKARFPNSDSNGPIIFGGSEWQDLIGSAKVAYLDGFWGKWRSCFYWSNGDFINYWRWLVVDK